MESTTSAFSSTIASIAALLFAVFFQFATLVHSVKNQVVDVINPPCSKPITYKLGKLDPKFEITTQEVKKEIENATLIWEEPISKNLFEYSQEGEITIDFIFDERQSISNEINEIEGSLKNQKNSIQPQVEEYRKQSAEFSKKLQELNSDIDYWNSQGGAPEEVYNQLKQREQDLKNEADRLNSLAKSLNQLSDNYNVTINKLNETIGSYNDQISTKPEEGVYDPQTKTIEIYFVTDPDELVHTLAHELGHALSIDHIEIPKAIMFPKSTTTTKATTEDIRAVKSACKIEG